MKDRLVTILLSVATTYGVTRAVPERPDVLDVDRLIVRKELIVSGGGGPPVRSVLSFPVVAPLELSEGPRKQAHPVTFAGLEKKVTPA